MNMETEVAEEEDFPELQEFLAAQQRRHRQIIMGLILGGLLSIVVGFIIFALAPKGKSPSMGGGAVAVMLVGVGVVMVVRGIISAVTDIDLRDRKEFSDPAFSELAESKTSSSQSDHSSEDQAANNLNSGASTSS